MAPCHNAIVYSLLVTLLHLLDILDFLFLLSTAPPPPVPHPMSLLSINPPLTSLNPQPTSDTLPPLTLSASPTLFLNPSPNPPSPHPQHIIIHPAASSPTLSARLPPTGLHCASNRALQASRVTTTKTAQIRPNFVQNEMRNSGDHMTPTITTSPWCSGWTRSLTHTPTRILCFHFSHNSGMLGNSGIPTLDPQTSTQKVWHKTGRTSPVNYDKLGHLGTCWCT